MQAGPSCCSTRRRLACPDAVLWLWATNAHLPDAFEVVRARVKDRAGSGDWPRGRTEHCLLAARGRAVVTLAGQSAVLRGAAREHSRKPEEFYRLVESLCPGTKVALFARARRAGWVAHGRQAGLFGREG